MLGEIHALKVLRSNNVPTPASTKGKIIGGLDLSGNEIVDPEKPVDPETPPPEPFAYTYIIYGVFVEGEFPNFYWCDENAQVESPPVLAEGYDGTTALRDGLAVVVSGVFYQ